MIQLFLADDDDIVDMKLNGNANDILAAAAVAIKAVNQTSGISYDNLLNRIEYALIVGDENPESTDEETIVDIIRKKANEEEGDEDD